MPKKKAGSTRSKREVDTLFSETWEGVLGVLTSLNAKLKNKKPLRDEEVRFVKNAAALITSLQQREKEITGEEPTLPEGKLKQYVEQLWKNQGLYQQAMGNDSLKLDEKALNDILKALDYYRCEECNELHKADEECIFQQFLKLKTNKQS